MLFFLYILPFLYSPIYPIIILGLISFSNLVSFIPTVFCEGVNDPFSVIQQFSDLSSLNTKNMIQETYSGVSGIYIFQCTETGGIYIGSSIDLYHRFNTHFGGISSNLHLQNAANK
jgi:hypothetical protein